MGSCLQVTSLSGGERRRLQLAAVLVEKPNLLILDEPTNDLDLQTVEVVEELLSEYKGCLLVVSHDRTFMENLADRLFVVTGDGLVRMFDGLYSEVIDCLPAIAYWRGLIMHASVQFAAWNCCTWVCSNRSHLAGCRQVTARGCWACCQAKGCVVLCIHSLWLLLEATA